MRAKRASQRHFDFPGGARRLMRRAALVAACLFVGASALANCQKPGIEPVALQPEDVCAHCKMSISEKRYAAELIDREGEARKFDDITCMVKFVKNPNNTTKAVAYFVMDFDERQWIKADNAHYVRSSELSTPMNGGIIAFNDKSKAEEASAKYHGKLLSFKDVLNP
jgi:copper chaperone NosL